MKLDRDAVDYIIEVAQGSGFALVGLDTREDIDLQPSVTLRFLQVKKPTSEPAKPPEKADPIAKTIRNQFKTLDDDPEAD
jgi:hypothetical protein